jgi:hypothetical protein
MYIIICQLQKVSFYNLNTVFGRLVMFSVCHINMNSQLPNKHIFAFNFIISIAFIKYLTQLPHIGL